MKKTFNILILAAAVLTAAACKDGFLDRTPLDKLTEDAVFNSVGLAEAHVNSMYSVLPDFLQEGNIGCISDEGYFRYGGTSTRYIAMGSMDPDNIVYMEEGGAAHNTRTTVLNIWNRAYKYIRDMNYFISRVEAGTEIDKDPEERDRLLGEVYFLRAWIYTNMVERYAGVPMIKYTFGLDDKFGIQRNDYDYCVDEILADLDKADNLLPLKSRAGRANKVISKALRSRLTLLAASPLFNDPQNPEGGIFRGKYSQDKWTRAFDASKEAVEIAEANGYKLANTYDQIWKDVECPENIWCKFLSPLGYTVHKGQLLYPPEHYSGWSSMEPTQAMVSEYTMKNGKMWFEEGSGYDPSHPFANRDPRFYKTVAAPFYPFSYTNTDGDLKTVNLELYLLYEKKTRDDFDKTKGATKMLDYSKKPLDLGEYPSTTFYKLHKWHDPAVPISEKETASVLYPWIRLAEIYLNYAEAAYMVGEEGICRDYINKIRDRKDVMMPHIEDSGTNLWDRLVNERRIELAFEAFRYFDVRRWKVADFYENVDLYGLFVMVLDGAKKDTVYRMPRIYDPASELNNMVYYSEGQTYDYTWLGQTYTIDYGDCAKGVMPAKKMFPANGSNYLMPIPRPEITKSEGSIIQNPGYN
jgi:hypothetical protein